MIIRIFVVWSEEQEEYFNKNWVPLKCNDLHWEVFSCPDSMGTTYIKFQKKDICFMINIFLEDFNYIEKNIKLGNISSVISQIFIGVRMKLNTGNKAITCDNFFLMFESSAFEKLLSITNYEELGSFIRDVWPSLDPNARWVLNHLDRERLLQKILDMSVINAI